MSVINYQTQQEKLIPRVAEMYALAASGAVIEKLCQDNMELVKSGDSSLLQETHSCLCTGKTLFSEIVYEGMEICRKACGGHGFSQYSGFPFHISEYLANLTH